MNDNNKSKKAISRRDFFKKIGEESPQPDWRHVSIRIKMPFLHPLQKFLQIG